MTMIFILWYLAGLILTVVTVILFRLDNKIVKDKYDIRVESTEVLNITNGEMILIPLAAFFGLLVLIPFMIGLVCVVSSSLGTSWASKPFFKKKERNNMTKRFWLAAIPALFYTLVMMGWLGLPSGDITNKICGIILLGSYLLGTFTLVFYGIYTIILD